MNRRSADLKTQTPAMDRRDAGMNRHQREMDRREATLDCRAVTVDGRVATLYCRIAALEDRRAARENFILTGESPSIFGTTRIISMNWIGGLGQVVKGKSFAARQSWESRELGWFKRSCVLGGHF